MSQDRFVLSKGQNLILCIRVSPSRTTAVWVKKWFKSCLDGQNGANFPLSLPIWGLLLLLNSAELLTQLGGYFAATVGGVRL